MTEKCPNCGKKRQKKNRAFTLKETRIMNKISDWAFDNLSNENDDDYIWVRKGTKRIEKEHLRAALEELNGYGIENLSNSTFRLYFLTILREYKNTHKDTISSNILTHIRNMESKLM